MHILSKVFCLFFSLCLATQQIYSQMPMGPQGAPGQFKPQDIDAILSSMTEEDFNNILTELSRLSPQELEELEKIGRQVLLDNGIDPETGKALTAPSGEPVAKPTETPVVAKPIEQKQLIKTQNPENVQIILDAIIKQINTLRQKAQGNEQIARRLAQWAEPLNDLIFYLKVINKKVHHDRLATKDFDALFKDLESLSRQLLTYQPHIMLTEKSVDQDDPYKILGLSYDATSEQITAQYTKLKNKHNPKKIKKELKAENATKKEIAREVRAAELTLSLIQDAYDQLNDPKTKKLVDDKRLTQPTDQLSSAAQSNLTKVLEAISNSVYQAKLLDQLQDFLKKYEPEQLAQKQAFEEAQTQRKKEQTELAKTQPKLTHTKYDRNDYPQQLPTPYKYDDFGRGAYPSAFGPTMPAAPTAVPLAPIKKDEKEEKSSSGGGKGGNAGAQGGTVKSEDDNTKNIMKELERQNEDKKKKEAAKKQEDMQRELAALKAERDARKELEGKKPEKPVAENQNPIRNRPQTTRTDRELIDEIRSNLVKLKKQMQKESSRKLFKDMEFKGGLKKPLPDEALSKLSEQLKLDAFTESCDALYDNLPQEPKALSIVKREWETLTQEYSNTLSCLRKHLREEEKKYTKTQPAKPLTKDLQDLMTAADDALLSFNNLSQTLLGKPTLSPEVECEEFLPIIKAAE